MCSVDRADMLGRSIAWIVVGIFLVYSSAILRVRLTVKNKRRGNAFSVFKTRKERCATNRAELSSKLILWNFVNLEGFHGRLLQTQI
jgi:hypothetical protein